MRTRKQRTVVAFAVFVVLSAGLVASIGFGTLSGFGWETISMLCPLGALTSMIASRALVPRSVVALLIAAVVVVLLGRVFCGWVCPVPLLDRLRAFFRSPRARVRLQSERHDEIVSLAERELACSGAGEGAGAGAGEGAGAGCKRDCSSCGSVRARLDSRHAILGGALLSTAIFGFPVFCVVCPIGLSFAAVLVVWRLFAMGDITVSVVLIPLVLIVELVFLRKWCSRFCPLSALMNLVARFNRTWRPTIDDSKCLETSRHVACSKCAEVCDADINLRHPTLGERGLADCTRCRACVESCPAHAITMPFTLKKAGGGRDGLASGNEAVLASPPQKD